MIRFAYETCFHHFTAFRFSGVGSIRVPNIPKQYEAFEGKIIHSAYWDKDYDFQNKTVAVVGSGTR